MTTSTSDSTFAVSWFPNDARMLYSADQGGNELDHLYVREVDGTTRDLTPGEKVKAGFDGWSADGKSFYLQTNERDPAAFALYRYATDGYERTPLSRTNDPPALPALSPACLTFALVNPPTTPHPPHALSHTTAPATHR